MTKTHDNLRSDVVKSLYQIDLLNNENLIIEDEQVLKLTTNVIEKLEEIDDIISDTLFNYTIERLSFIDRAIIRLATYELAFTELPEAIIINEAVEITKEYSDLDDERQHKFNNKLLDNIKKAVRG